MILSNQDILEAIKEGRFVIDPVPPRENFSTSSLDLRVGMKFWEWKKQAKGVGLHVNCSIAEITELDRYAKDVPLDAKGFVDVPAHGFLLGRTLEKIYLPHDSKLAARVEGRSGLARLGLGVHITAPTIHTGFEGPIVLEFMNHGPHVLQLEAGKTCICQLVIETVLSEPTVELDTVFQNQTGAFGQNN